MRWGLIHLRPPQKAVGRICYQLTISICYKWSSLSAVSHLYIQGSVLICFIISSIILLDLTSQQYKAIVSVTENLLVCLVSCFSWKLAQGGLMKIIPIYPPKLREDTLWFPKCRVTVLWQIEQFPKYPWVRTSMHKRKLILEIFFFSHFVANWRSYK